MWLWGLVPWHSDPWDISQPDTAEARDVLVHEVTRMTTEKEASASRLASVVSPRETSGRPAQPAQHPENYSFCLNHSALGCLLCSRGNRCPRICYDLGPTGFCSHTRLQLRKSPSLCWAQGPYLSPQGSAALMPCTSYPASWDLSPLLAVSCSTMPFPCPSLPCPFSHPLLYAPGLCLPAPAELSFLGTSQAPAAKITFSPVLPRLCQTPAACCRPHRERELGPCSSLCTRLRLGWASGDGVSPAPASRGPRR